MKNKNKEYYVSQFEYTVQILVYMMLFIPALYMLVYLRGLLFLPFYNAAEGGSWNWGEFFAWENWLVAAIFGWGTAFSSFLYFNVISHVQAALFGK